MITVAPIYAKSPGICYSCPVESRAKWQKDERIAYRKNDGKGRPVCMNCANAEVLESKAIWEEDQIEGANEKTSAPSVSSFTENSEGSITAVLREIAHELRKLNTRLDRLTPDSGSAKSESNVLPFVARIEAVEEPAPKKNVPTSMEDPRLEHWLTRDEFTVNQIPRSMRSLQQYASIEEYEEVNVGRFIFAGSVEFMVEFLPGVCKNPPVSDPEKFKIKLASKFPGKVELSTASVQ